MKNWIFVTFICFFSLGCGDTFTVSDTLEPMYEKQEIPSSEHIIELHLSSEIAPVKIEPVFIRKVLQTLFGWVPLVGDVLELPLNLVSALMPQFKELDIANLPDEASIQDPEVQKIVKSIQVENIYLMVTPFEQIPEQTRKKKCFIFFKCREPNLDFIDEIRVYIAIKGQKEKGILIAKSNGETKINSKKTQIVLNVVENLNIKYILTNIDLYEIRTIFRGKPPKRDIYIQGGVSLKIKADFNL